MQTIILTCVSDRQGYKWKKCRELKSPQYSETKRKGKKIIKRFEGLTGWLICYYCGQSSAPSIWIVHSQKWYLTPCSYTATCTRTSVHFSSAFTQQHVFTEQTLLQVQRFHWLTYPVITVVNLQHLPSGLFVLKNDCSHTANCTRTSVHFSPAFKQQHVFTELTLLHVQDASLMTSSGACLVPSHTNSASFDVLHTFQPCSWGEGTSRCGITALLQIAAW